MIYVMERFYLKSNQEGSAKLAMQALDDLVGPAAHDHPGWCGHATFLQSTERPSEVFIIYPWRNEELHAELSRQEEPMLAEFYKQYCSGPREVTVYQQLPVDVEPDHESQTLWLGHH